MIFVKYRQKVIERINFFQRDGQSVCLLSDESRSSIDLNGSQGLHELNCHVKLIISLPNNNENHEINPGFNILPTRIYERSRNHLYWL
jgi:hypothetical protein